MTDEERKALVGRLRDDELIAIKTVTAAADQIEADGQRIAELEREVERRTYDGIHTCHDQCQRVACVLRRRIAELEAAIREITGV